MSSEDEMLDADVSLDEIIIQQNVEEEKQQIIEENLKNIQFSKLRLAQECYYANKGRSPLTRSNIIESKPPVHARLGKRIRFRSFPANITTDSILPKNRRILRLNRNNINTRGYAGKSLRLFRSGSAQLRLERIRRQQAEALNNMQLVSPLGKFRLRRRRPNLLPFQTTAINYTVQVPNNRCSDIEMHNIQSELDAEVQNAIEHIQVIHTHPSEIIQSLPLLSMNTTITLDERFSSLP